MDNNSGKLNNTTENFYVDEFGYYNNTKNEEPAFDDMDFDLDFSSSDEKKERKYKRKTQKSKSDSMELYDWVQCIISAMLCGIFIFMFIGRVVGIFGSSMLPTLVHGDKAIVSSLFYTPSYGDIVIIQKDSFDDDPIVKRVIATEGQTVDIDFEEGIVYVDGVALEEDYVNSLTTTPIDFTEAVTVPENCVFVLGDNRNASNDSRDSRISMVDERCIIGKVYFIIFPGVDMNGHRDWSRIGSPY